MDFQETEVGESKGLARLYEEQEKSGGEFNEKLDTQKEDEVEGKQEEGKAKEDEIVEPEGKAKEPEKQTEEVEEEEEEQELDEETLASINTFKEKTGIQDLEIEGDFTLDNVADLFVKEKEKIVQKYSVYESDPDVKALAEWKAAGNSLEDFTAVPPEFKRDDFDLENKVHTDVLVKTYFALKGLDEDDSTFSLEALKADEDAYKKTVNKSLDFIEKSMNDKRQKYLDDVKEKQDKAAADSNAFLDHIKTSIKENRVGEHKVTKALEFGNYLNTPEYSKKWNNLTNDQKMILEYLVFNDFNFTEFGATNKSKAPVIKRAGISLIGKTSKSKNSAGELSEEEQIARLRKGNLLGNSKF